MACEQTVTLSLFFPLPAVFGESKHAGLGVPGLRQRSDGANLHETETHGRERGKRFGILVAGTSVRSRHAHATVQPP